MRYPKHTIKITLTTNYNFKKLADNIEKVLDGVSDDFGIVAESKLKDNINDANYPPLSPTTKRLRRNVHSKNEIPNLCRPKLEL